QFMRLLLIYSLILGLSCAKRIAYIGFASDFYHSEWLSKFLSANDISSEEARQNESIANYIIENAAAMHGVGFVKKDIPYPYLLKTEDTLQSIFDEVVMRVCALLPYTVLPTSADYDDFVIMWSAEEARNALNAAVDAAFRNRRDGGRGNSTFEVAIAKHTHPYTVEESESNHINGDINMFTCLSFDQCYVLFTSNIFDACPNWEHGYKKSGPSYLVITFATFGCLVLLAFLVVCVYIRVCKKK
ncbi:hypothetical protein PMAYCL1PPCAC_14171, partial [Pristionchus mayeri]